MTNFKKLNLLYEDLVISHCQYKKYDIWKTGPDIGATAPLSGYKRRRLYMSGACMRDYRVRLFSVHLFHIV